MARPLEDAGLSAGLSAGLTSEHLAHSAEWLRTDPAAQDSLDPLAAPASAAGCMERL